MSGVYVYVCNIPESFLCRQKLRYSVLLKAEFNINGTNSLRAGRRVLFPLMHGE